jgi:hypothetical protein
MLFRRVKAIQMSTFSGSQQWLSLLLRLIVFSLASMGLLGVSRIVWAQIVHANGCPSLGPIPACYLVMLGYLLILISTLISEKWRFTLFSLGWLPLFGLAATGTVLEIMGREVCPKAQFGLPACYFSLAILLIMASAFHLERRWSSSAGPSTHN